MTIELILDKIKKGDRVSSEEAIFLYNNASLTTLGEAANIVRFRNNPEKKVTYIIDRNINYTNICTSGCLFCAFYRGKEHEESYVLSFEEIGNKIEETLELEGVQILLQGGLNPDLGLDYYVKLFKLIKSNYNIWIHGLSPPEIDYIVKLENKPVKYVLEQLVEAGLNSIPGGGAEILSGNIRSKISEKKCTTDEWLNVMEVAHDLGLRTTATMMFGSLDKIEDRIAHLEKIRQLQDKTFGFTAFIPWSFQPDNTRLKQLYPEIVKSGTTEYLKMLAISRIYLDNIKNIQVSWVTQGAQVASVALHFGGNDFGSLMIEENVVRSAGVKFRMSIEEIEHYIKSAGFTPERRQMIY